MIVENDVIKRKQKDRGDDYRNTYSTDDEELDFKAKAEEEVIKVAKCTYANDFKGQSTFYFCQCSVEEFYPICEACAQKCHKEHNPTLKLEGIYTCMCGKGNHHIHKENERRFNEKKLKTMNQCFFSKFMDVTPHRGYFNYEGKTICSVCVQSCFNKGFDDKDLYLSDEAQPYCNCDKHYEVNVINLNLELISKPKFHMNLQNFNFNILAKITTTKQMYLDYLVAKISEYQSAPSHKNSKNFFSNFINFKILELFSAFASRWENKFFHVRNYFQHIPNEILYKMMSLDEPVSMLTENEAPDFATAKFYFAEFIFNYIIRTYHLKFNNSWNVRTIINMNLFQRFIYLKEIKNFFKFDYQQNANMSSSESKFEEMSLTFVELYDNILKINENFEFSSQIFSYIFPTFNRIFKYLIKYNLISNELKAKYFELVLDTLSLGSEKDDRDYKGSELYIIKSILYCLIYRNDVICINYIRQKKDPAYKKLVFEDYPEHQNLSKVFTMVVHRLNRTEDLSRSIIYDFYVRKIFEMLVGKNEFYLKNLENLLHPSIPDYHIKLLESDELQLEMRRYLDLHLMSEITQFTNKLNSSNREYLDYNMSYDDYLKKTNGYFRDLKNFVVKNLNYIPDLSKKFQIFNECHSSDDFTNAKIISLQECVKYTLFYQKLEEFFFIYSEGKRFGHKEKRNANSSFHTDYLKFILNFLFLLVNKNYENLCLAMNFKTKYFVTALYEEKETLFDYLELISEMLFSKTNYQIDNFYFLTETINDIIDMITFQDNEDENIFENLKNIEIFGRVMKIAQRTITQISMLQPDPLNCIERIMKKIREIKGNNQLNKILNEYFNDRHNLPGSINISDEENKESLHPIENFIISYLNFCNELIYSDLYLFGLITDSDFIYDPQLVRQILTNKQVDLHPEMEYPLTRFYCLTNLSFNIKFNNINNHLKNLYMKNIPRSIKNISIIHLSRTYDDNNPTTLPLAEIIIKNAELILNLMNNFENKFHSISSYYLKTGKIVERKLVLSKYFEHCFVRPVFIIFNQFILNMNFIKGSECYTIYELLFNFLKCIIFFYVNMNKKEEVPGLLNENANDESKSFENKLLQGVDILDFETISVRVDMDLNVVDEIREESKKISKNEIKYFEIEKLYKLLVNIVTKILRVTPEVKDEEEDESDSLKYASYHAKSSTQKAIKVKKPFAMIRLEKLITKYKTKLISTYDNSLAFIKNLELCEGDYEEDLGVNLYKYLLSKFSDSLTDENWLSIKDYENGDISKINIENFKFQNVYALIYLNALFYNDSPRFQSILEQNIGDSYEIFFNFLTINLIFPSVCCEVTKLYELEKFHQIGNPSLAFEISKISIKLLQNLCESHNQVFQDRFYSFTYNVDVVEFTTKDYFSTFDKEKDPGAEKEVDKNYFSKLKDGIIKNIRETRRDLKRDTAFLDRIDEEINRDESKVLKASDRKVSKKFSTIAKPLLLADGMISAVKEQLDKRKQRELEEAQALEGKKLSFFNFVAHNMRLLIASLNLDSETQSVLLKKNRQIKNYDHILEIYQRFSDLIVEMLQGTKCTNYDNYYKKLPDSLHIFNENLQISNYNTLDAFVFIQKCMEIKSFLFESKEIFDKVSIQMKYNVFFTINNLINQEMVDISVIKIFIAIFPPDKIIDLISKYLRGLYVNHVLRIKYVDPQFLEQFDDLELNREIYADLIRRFKDNSNIYNDDFFKLASQMYLFLTILGEKYKIPEAERIINLHKKDVIYNPDESQEVNQNTNFYSKIVNYIKEHFTSGQHHVDQVKRKKKTKYQINNLIMTSKFFDKIIKSCEFMIDSSNDEGDELNLKILYFIVDPRVYLISKNNIDVFLDEVDRSSSTTKLKSLIDVLNSFLSEVEYKDSNLKKSDYLKWMMEVDYKDVNLMNFVISLVINAYLLLFLKGDSFNSHTVYYVVSLMALVQIFINIVYLFIFFKSKYRFYVLVEKKNYSKKSLSLTDWLKVNLVNSFLFNDEIYLLILNIIIGVLGCVSSYATFLFSLQLLTVIKFVPTIKEIVIAFKLRFSQLISMIGFLAILIFFYSNIGFYFFPDEFVKEIDGGSEENLCQTLLECSITYFNLGVRSGGGIGDLLDMKPFRETSIYWLRWVTDMVFYITVILLLLNMINGVIVSTFSQIREESNQKDEDIKNKCFICNIDRVEFEKRKIPFSEHQKFEHNTKTYIRYLINLKLTNIKDLDADQSFILQCLKERDISCFPVLRSFSVGNMQQQDDDGEEGDDE